jgi:hypothetical protein
MGTRAVEQLSQAGTELDHGGVTSASRNKGVGGGWVPAARRDQRRRPELAARVSLSWRLGRG